MSKPSFSSSSFHINLRMHPKFQHRLRLAIAVARRLSPDLQLELIIQPFNSLWIVVSIIVTPRKRTAYRSRAVLRGIHSLLEVTHCPLDNMSFTFVY